MFDKLAVKIANMVDDVLDSSGISRVEERGQNKDFGPSVESIIFTGFDIRDVVIIRFHNGQIRKVW